MGKDFKEDKKKKEFPNVSKVNVIWFPGACIRNSSGNTLTFSDAPSHRWIDICWVYSRLWSVSKIYPSWCCAYINVLNGYLTTSEPLLFVYTFPRQGHYQMVCELLLLLVCVPPVMERRERWCLLPCQEVQTPPQPAVSLRVGDVRPVRPCVSGLGGNHTSKIGSLLVLRRRFRCCCVIVKNNNIGAITGKYRQGQQGGLSMLILEADELH